MREAGLTYCPQIKLTYLVTGRAGKPKVLTRMDGPLQLYYMESRPEDVLSADGWAKRLLKFKGLSHAGPVLIPKQTKCRGLERAQECHFKEASIWNYETTGKEESQHTCDLTNGKNFIQMTKGLEPKKQF